MLGVLLTTSQATFAADWNANSADTGAYTYQALAGSVAGTTGITLTGTFLGIVYTMLSFIGYANSSYYGGEIRGNPTRTQGLAIFGAPLIFAVLIGVLYAATYATFGRNFLIGASLSYVTGGALTSIPSPLFLTAYILHGDPSVAGFLSFGLILTFFGFALVYFIIPTGTFSPGPSTVSSRRRLPASAVTGSPGWLSSYWPSRRSWCSGWEFTPLCSRTSSYSNFGFWLAVGLVCLGGALFPFLRPQLFRSSPRIVQAKIGPVPIITIVGIASWIAAWFVSYAASTASYVEPSGAYSYAYLLFLPIVFVIGVVGYWISRAIQMSRGIPMDLINKELPPE